MSNLDERHITRTGAPYWLDLGDRLDRVLRNGRNPKVAFDRHEDAREYVLIDGSVTPEETVELTYQDGDYCYEKLRYDVIGTAREVMARIEDEQARIAKEREKEDAIRKAWRECPVCHLEMRHTGAGRRYCENTSCPYPGHD